MPSSRKQTCRRILLVIFGLSATADCIMDWLFYSENAGVKKGLVYGEVDTQVVQSLLAFSIIGSVFFFCELLCLVWEFRWKSGEGSRQELATDVLSLFVVCFEDLPQISINLYLAVCREEAISTIQLIKAIFALIDNFFRFSLTMVEYMCHSKCKSKCQSKCKGRLKNLSCRSLIRFIIRLGAFIEVILAASIFILSNTQRTGSEVVFKTPKTFTEDTYDDGPYFTNVSVLMSMSPYSHAGHLGPADKDAVVNWMQLTSVNNIRASDTSQQPILFSFQYENNGTDALKMSIWENNKNVWSPPNCLVLHLNSGQVTQELNSTCGSKGYFGNSSTQAFVKFRFDAPSGTFGKRIFGQIFFNMKLLENGTCKDVKRYSDDISQVSANRGTIVMHYFRINEISPGTQGYFFTKGTDARFFRKEDLTDVTEAWKTSWGQCRTSGSLGPVLDPSIQVKCDRN